MAAVVASHARHHHSSFFNISLPTFSRKPRISSPYSARQHHSPIRLAASSRTSSDNGSSVSQHGLTTVSAEQLQERAISLVDALLNTSDLTHVSTLLPPELHFHYDSPTGSVTLTSLDAFLSFWRNYESTDPVGDSTAVVKEAAVDELQRKVWVVAEVGATRRDRRTVESVEMLTFDETGRVFEIQHYQRIRAGRGRGD
jgi:hypothetical protein